MASEKNGRPNKSAFIRQHPDASAAEVVEKGKAAGLAFSPAFVHAIRSKMRAGKKPKAKRGRKPRSTSGRQPRAAGKPSASDFVRSMPVTMKAKEIVTAAKARGIKLSANLVYMVRSVDKKKRGGGARRKPGPKPRSVAASTGDLSSFKKMALDLGIATARRALDELERGLAELLQ